MTVADTSIQAYKEHQAQGKTTTQATSIYRIMQPGKDYSRRELVAVTLIELSSVCGRVNELLQLGLLKEGKKRKCRITGKTIVPVYKDTLL
jgi:hypothetical protein